MPGKKKLGNEKTKEARKKKTKEARKVVLNQDRSSLFPHFATVLSANARKKWVKENKESQEKENKGSQ